MPHRETLTRREILQTAALGALTLPWLGASSGCMTQPSAPFAPDAEHGLRLGVATYSTRNLSVADTITAIKALRLTNAGVYKNHLNWETATPDETRAAAEKFHAAGITITGTGVVNFSNDEAKCRRAFENARIAQLVTLVCKPDHDALPLVEKLAKEYDQRVAIHNHGPEDKGYPTPTDAWNAVKSLDARLGLCIDVGHARRAKADPVAAIREYAARVYDVHLKDSLAEPGALKDIPAEVGTGHVDIRGVLHALLEINYRGVVAFEYEKAAANPVPGLAESVGYVRGLLATGV